MNFSLIFAGPLLTQYDIFSSKMGNSRDAETKECLFKCVYHIIYTMCDTRYSYAVGSWKIIGFDM